MGIIAWVIFGAIAGWVASKITGRDDQMGCLMNIVVGVIGAFIGGAIVSLFTGGVLGAVVLLAIVTLIFGRKK